MREIYLDYNASTPIDPVVADAMRLLLEGTFGNPSSGHWAGTPAKTALENARRDVAGLLGCAADEVIFTSGGSEANNLALKGVFFALRDKGNHIVTSAIEHPATITTCKFLERLGAEVTYLPVDQHGLVDPDDLRRALTPKTILISVMQANNEVGTIEPIEEISRIAREHGTLHRCRPVRRQDRNRCKRPRRRFALDGGPQVLRSQGSWRALRPARNTA